jgi:hypothetical protein
MAISNRSIVFVGNTSNIEVQGLTDINGNFVNNATVQVTTIVSVGDDTVVGGIALPITCPYLTGTDGDYRGTIPSTAQFSDGMVYEATIKVTALTGEIGEWQERIRAKTRRD